MCGFYRFFVHTVLAMVTVTRQENGEFCVTVDLDCWHRPTDISIKIVHKVHK